MSAEIPAGFEPRHESGEFTAHIGPMYIKLEEDGTMLHGFRAESYHANRRGVVHGGMLMSLADNALGMAVWRAVENKPCATVSMNSDFLAPARVGDWVEARGVITRVTRSMVFVRGQVTSNDVPVLTATGVWKRLGAD